MAYVDFPINSHLDRLKYDEIREIQSIFGKTWAPALGAALGVTTVILRNSAFNKPIYTGLWRCAITVPIFCYAGIMLQNWRQEKVRLKWAKIRHYIELHPEDFPPYPPRTKVGDTLAPWIPLRSGW